MLVKLGLTEQRYNYKAVSEVLHNGPASPSGPLFWGGQTAHDWLRRYARSGLAGIADRAPSPPAVHIRSTRCYPSLRRVVPTSGSQTARQRWWLASEISSQLAAGVEQRGSRRQERLELLASGALVRGAKGASNGGR